MNITGFFKYLCKMAVLLIGAVFLRLFLDMMVILQMKLGVLLATWLGPIGDILLIFVETVGIPLLLATIIGILGGLWIGGKTINGFILSLTFYLWGVIIFITTLGLRLDWVTFFNLLGLLIVPIIGTLIYAAFSKRHHATAMI